MTVVFFFFSLAENVAKEYNISREQQDEYAVQSQQRAEEARKANKYQAEIVPVTVKDRKGEIVVNADEFPKPDTSVASLSKLRPAFTNVGMGFELYLVTLQFRSFSTGWYGYRRKFFGAKRWSGRPRFGVTSRIGEADVETSCQNSIV